MILRVIALQIQAEETKAHYINVCANFHVDINDPNDPNIVGRDTFIWHITISGVAYPFGHYDYIIFSDSNGLPICNSTSQVWGCIAKIIKEGAINY